MIPLLMLAAGLLIQDQAKRKSARAQQSVIENEQRNQAKLADEAHQQFQLNRDAWSAPSRIAQDQAATDKVRATGDSSANDAIQLFEGANAGSSSAGTSGAALRATAGRNSAAGAQLNGVSFGNNERRRLGLDIGANLSGIRQRSQRSLGMLPGELERASRSGQGLNTIGQLVAAYGQGGTASWLGGLAQGDAANAGNADYYNRSRTYSPYSPGATDVWGEQDPYHAQA